MYMLRVNPYIYVKQIGSGICSAQWFSQGKQSTDNKTETLQLVLSVINIFCIDRSCALDSSEMW